MEDFIDFVGGPPPLGNISFLFCSTYLKKERGKVVKFRSGSVHGG